MGDSFVHGFPLILLLVSIGFIAGSYGTLVGLGGAVVLAPMLLLLYPQANPRVLTSITMGIVFLNSLSGTLAYARQKRIDYRNGMFFAMATIPGAIIGVWTLRCIPQQAFLIIFGIMLLVFAAIIWLRPKAKSSCETTQDANCTIVDYSGMRFSYSCNRSLGIALSFAVGFIAGLLGIGGGIMHMPILLFALHFPVHIATATSQFILGFTGLTGTLTHASSGTYAQSWQILLWIALGVIPGAQAGAWLSPKIKGLVLVRLLALALVIAGIRLIAIGVWS
ncbi:MAG: sulfite exporter TauE/SafE family protein [Dehalococcoidia bacterium]|nr:sulfite exporter TauE/SafE family protein [Dehalococcoidia bacterium]